MGIGLTTNQTLIWNGSTYLSLTSTGSLNVNLNTSGITLNTAITGTPNVNISSSGVTLGTNANLVASGITLNTAITGTPNVNISSSGITLNTTLASSGITLNTAITGTPNVNLSSSGITLNTAITGTPNINISSSGITLNTNLAASGVTLNVAITGTPTVVGNTSNANDAVATDSNNLDVVGYNYGYNGTTWDRIRTAEAIADATAGKFFANGLWAFNGTTFDRVRSVNTGQLVVTLKNSSGTEPAVSAGFGDSTSSTTNMLGTGGFNLIYNGSTWDRKRSIVSIGDGSAGVGLQSAGLVAFNGTTYDRLRTANTGELKVSRASIGTSTFSFMSAQTGTTTTPGFAMNGLRNIDFYITGTFTGVSATLQYSENGTSWRTLAGIKSDGTNASTLTTTNQWIRAAVPPQGSVRINLTAISTGSVTIVGYASADTPGLNANGYGNPTVIQDYNGNFPSYTANVGTLGDANALAFGGGANISALYGYNGSSYDRLRTANTGELKTNHASVGSTTITLINAATIITTSSAAALGGMRTIDLYLTGTFTGVTVSFQYTVDGGTNWKTLAGERSNDGANVVSLTTTGTWLRCQVPPHSSIRAVLSAISSGSATVTAYAAADSPLMTPNGIGVGMRLVDFNGLYPTYTNVGSSLGDANAVSIIGGARVSVNYGYIGGGLYDRVRSATTFKTREYLTLTTGSAADVWYTAGKKWRLMQVSISATVAGKYSIRDGASSIVLQFSLAANDTVTFPMGNGLLSAAAGQTLWIVNGTGSSANVWCNAWGVEE
jgi:hypothetical protein